MKLYKIFDKVYRVEIRLMLGSLDELKQYVVKFGQNPDEIKESNGYTFFFGCGGILIWLPEFSPMNPKSHATLTHEITHAANIVFQERDIHYWNDCIETLTYYVEFLTKGFLEQLFKD